MSARKLFLLLSLIFMLAVLATLPQSTQAAQRGPNGAASITNAAPPPEDQVPQTNGRKSLWTENEGADYLLARSEYAASRRRAGDVPLTDEEVADQLYQGGIQTGEMRQGMRESSLAYGGAWTALGPNPIVQVSRQNNLTHMTGRIGALAMRSDGRMILGGATGGIWVFNTGTGKWEPKTDYMPAIAIGGLAIAPSNEDVVYAGTGEGETSGDSAAGNGVFKSLDGGTSWFHVSGAYFRGVSTGNIVVDPNDPDHLWFATMRGRGGNRRTTTPPNAKYGVWESTNGGLDWTLLKGTNDQFKGATDIEVDPQDVNILYASFWGTGIFKSTNGGQTWNKIMNGLPADADWSAVPTRFELAISHPVGQDPVLYTGFDYVDNSGDHHPARVWKSTDAGGTWTILPGGTSPENVEDYCTAQCTYDNLIEVAPDDPNVVFAGGSFDYGIGLGGIYRSDDGGQNWKNLGYDQHPDIHQLAFNPSDTQQVILGNDGGVWYSADRGGRPGPADPIDAVTWETLNGYVLGPVARTDIQLAQFTSIVTVPTVPGRYWGGTQDNGTLRKSTSSQTWSDLYSGDGGQVLVDPTDANFVYGNYYGISLYRATDGGSFFFNNYFIMNGIDQNDRSEFYVPVAMNQNNPNQLFYGTYRLYRTNNAKETDPSDVQWDTISGDLTSGCPGGAPNGARGCFISAIGISRGGGGVWVGSLDGYLHYARNGTTAASPTFTRVGAGVLPNRPIAGIAVDNSNSRVAYIAYNGYNGATPGFGGHVFKTTNGGKKFTNISGNLPNVPANWIILDPSEPDTLYVGMDTGPFVTYDGGANWAPLGTGFPIVPVWQMDLDPLHRVLVAGTHGRGAFRLTDAATTLPALVMSKTFPETPVGPGTDVSFNIEIRNIGNATATDVHIKDKVPKNTSFVSASDGGTVHKGVVEWTGLSIPSNGSKTVTLTLHINGNAKKKISNKSYSVTSAEGVGAKGSPRNVKIAPQNATMVSPVLQKGAQNPDNTIDYTVTVRNLGYSTDTFNLSVNGNTYPTEIRNAGCGSVITQTGALGPGATEDVCLRVSVPSGATDLQMDTVKLKAQSASDASVKATATANTFAITDDILLVDGDGDIPDVQSYYTAALDTYAQPYDVWDLAEDDVLPQNMLNAHAKVVWFTGNVYPGPLLVYEGDLKSFLDNGGSLFMSGQDILDQAAGTTSFVHDYLHIDWDGTEAQNDKATNNVTSVAANPVTDGIGTIAINHAVLGAAFEDQITPISPATGAFTDDAAKINALTLDSGSYQVMFLAFPFEAYGNASQKATLMANALNWFSSTQSKADTGKAAQDGKNKKDNKDKKDKKDNKGKNGGSTGGSGN